MRFIQGFPYFLSIQRPLLLLGGRAEIVEILVFWQHEENEKKRKNEKVNAAAATAQLFYNNNELESPVKPGLQREREF